MDKFQFFLGSWDLQYNVPKSKFGAAATGVGFGTFQKALNDKFIYFDYKAGISRGQKKEPEGSAHGIFGWDEKIQFYRYWWFESSGSFQSATCNFISDNVLFMYWHDTLIQQTFSKENDEKVVLRMEHPIDQGKNELILEVIFNKK